MTKEQITTLLEMVKGDQKVEAVYVNSWGSKTKCELTGINFELDGGVIKAVIQAEEIKEPVKAEEDIAA